LAQDPTSYHRLVADARLEHDHRTAVDLHRAGWSRRAELVGWLVVAMGALLRLREYAVDRSLWRDEAALVYNVLHRGYLGFNHPLDFEQGTPPGFFIAVKAVSQVFGSSEFALRAVPVLCGIGALVVAMVLVRRHLDAPTGLVALVLMGASPSLIYFAGEVKQYSTDAFVGLLILLAASSTWRRRYDVRSCVVLAIAGVAGVFCSHAATFVLVGVGLVLAWPVLRDRDWALTRRIVAVGAAWLAGWVTIYALFDRHLDSDTFLRKFWADAFLPIPPTNHAGLERWGSAISTLFGMLTGNNTLMWLLGPIAIIGIVHLWRTNRGVLAVLLIPWLAVVLASSRQLYPATERLVLFLIPLLAVLVAAGAVVIADVVTSRAPSPMLGQAVLAILVVVCAAVALHRFASPQPIEELRPLYERLHAEAQPGDTVYVAETAVPSFDYYRLRMGRPAARVVTGSASVSDSAAIDREIVPLATGGRVWLLTSAYWQPEGHTTPEVTAALDHLGHRVAEYDQPGSMLVLYDLTRPPEAGG
jgi:4-amino-4-deoxy-L-arabinose transferase-like glycosyltransferase